MESEMMELKKGTWAAEEDQKLVAYIEEHGHGSWRTLPAKAGLRRCGKSCRLRWTNYLKPDIKRGMFSLKEQQTIIQLHALVGNRWSTIAAHMPKRTDNEIKNFWNTHLVKRLTKMGIDPITHKPKNDATGSPDQTKDATYLSHMAQWESARLEAEARLVREHILSRNTNFQLNQLGSIGSRSASTRYHHQLLRRAATSSLASKPLPYDDVLQAWQSNNPHASASLINNVFTGSTSTSSESPISTLKFSENKFNVPNYVASIQKSIGAVPDTAIAKRDVQNNWKDLANQTMELQEEIFPNESTRTRENLTDLLVHDGQSHDGIGNCDSEYHEHENYWDNILNLVTLPSVADNRYWTNGQL